MTPSNGRNSSRSSNKRLLPLESEPLPLPVYDVESVIVDEHEFRCQSFKAQGPSCGRVSSGSGSSSSASAANAASAGAAHMVSSRVSAYPAATNKPPTMPFTALGATQPGVRPHPSLPPPLPPPVTTGWHNQGLTANETSRVAQATTSLPLHAGAEDDPSPPAAAAANGRANRDDEEDDAANFLSASRLTLGTTDPKRHVQLLDALLAFESGALDTVDVMERVATLLADHPQLLNHFNTFLPDGYRCQLLSPQLSEYTSCHTAGAHMTADAAIHLSEAFMARLCDRYAAQPGTLAKLHSILRDGALEDPTQPSPNPLKSPPGAARVYEQILSLLEGQPDLVEELTQYVPSSVLATGYLHTVVPPAAAVPSDPTEAVERNRMGASV